MNFSDKPECTLFLFINLSININENILTLIPYLFSRNPEFFYTFTTNFLLSTFYFLTSYLLPLTFSPFIREDLSEADASVTFQLNRFFLIAHYNPNAVVYFFAFVFS
jgi:hypothetical protein